MKKQPIERVGRIEKSIHDIYLLGVEMEAMNVLKQRNNKHVEIICALGSIKKQIDLVIEDLTIKKEDKLNPKKQIETARCERCHKGMMQSNIHGWICQNQYCEASIYY